MFGPRVLSSLALLAAACDGPPREEPLSEGFTPCVVMTIETSDTGCFPRVLPADAGQTTCTVLEARAGDPCTCDPVRARLPVPATDTCWVQAIQNSPAAPRAGSLCICEIPQAGGSALLSCLQDLEPQGDGFCFVDPAEDATANSGLVAGCPTNEQRALRFIGRGVPDPGASAFVACP
jgi:hypothetical protein